MTVCASPAMFNMSLPRLRNTGLDSNIGVGNNSVLSFAIYENSIYDYDR